MLHSERKVSAREFNQNVSAIKKAASEAPVFVTDRGRPTHVLMSYDEYERLQKGRRSVLDLSGDPRAEADFDFDPPRDRSPPRRADFD